MKLYSIFIVLLCYLYGAINASTSSLDDTSSPIKTSDPDSLATLPATASPVALWDNRISGSFSAEFALEIVAIAVNFAAFISHIGCNLPDLLSTTLIFSAILYAMKMVLVISRTGIIRESANAAAGPLRLTLGLQVVLSTMVGGPVFFCFAAFLVAAIQRQYCDISTHTTAVSLSKTLLVAMLMGILELILTYGNMILWTRDKDEPLAGEALQG